MSQQYITAAGLKKLKIELALREGQSRAEIARRLAMAKELGDLSENAEYSEAREAREINENRISELKNTINNLIVVEPSKLGSTVTLGSTVIAICKGKERKFTIVGANESDPVKGLISNETPFGVAFMGKKKGDEVKVETPSGGMKCTIESIK